MTISNLTSALNYAAQGWPVFPCRPGKKNPLTEHGFHDASIETAQIEEWWERWPEAWIGTPTGKLFIVLDIDVKDPSRNGWDSLAGKRVLTPSSITPSGGAHWFLLPPEREIRNSAGKVAPGLDVRGPGGYVCLPPAGYRWHPLHNFDTLPLAPTPAWMFPPEAKPKQNKPIMRVNGLSPYADKAIDSACERIMRAPDGTQEVTLNSEAFAIGTLAGAGGIPEGYALRALLWAAEQMPDYKRPWRRKELEDKVERAFRDGLSHPREVRADVR